MAISTYAELTSALTSWLNRSSLESLYPTFIALFEARANRSLRVPGMETTATATTTDNAVALPDDFRAARDIYIDGYQLRGLSPQSRRELELRVPSGNPQGYAIQGLSMEFVPPVDDGTEVGMLYYASIPALTSTATTNWLLTAHPDLYLYGVLANAYDYLRDGEQAANMLGLSDRIMDEMNREANTKRLPGGPLIAKSGVLDG